MKFEILNVKHGFAAYAIATDNSVLLFVGTHRLAGHLNIYGHKV